MTRILCNPLSIGRGLVGLMVLPLTMGLLTLIDAAPVEAASRTQRTRSLSRLTGAYLNRPLPLIHDATVSILSAPPAFWQRPAGDPTALNPVAARCHGLATAGLQLTPFTALSSNTASAPARSASVDALTTTFYVSESPADAAWSTDTEPLTTQFSTE